MESIDKLRLEFETKIRNEWDTKWSSFGCYDALKNNRRSKFYTALATEISKSTNCPVSRDTVNRFDSKTGGDSEASLNAFARYLKYNSFQSFTEVTAEINPERKKSPYRLSLYAVFVIAASALLYYFYRTICIEKEKIVEVIENANHAQYKAYLQLPEVDSTEIANYYLKTGAAYKSILTLLKESENTNRYLNLPAENPSYYKIFSIEVVDLEKNKAIAKTSEHWFLKWYDLDKLKYTISYDVQNEQIYELVKENNNWLIANNYFQGKATSIDF